MAINDTMTRLLGLLDAAGVQYQKLLDHPPSHTSDESRRIRVAAGGPDAIGAKALVQKLTHRDKTTAVAVFVLPGSRRFNARLVLDQHPEIKRTRFLTTEEVLKVTSLEIGAIPPFGRSLFPQVDRLFFDPSLLECDCVGFNAGSHESSIIMKPADLVSAARPDDIFGFSTYSPPVMCDELVEGRNYRRVTDIERD